MSKIVLLTGASRGLGAVFHEEFKRRGWGILAPSRYQLDMSDPESIWAYVQNLTEVGVSLSGVLLNAGIWQSKGFIETSSTAFNQVIATNLLGPISLVRNLLEHKLLDKDVFIVGVCSRDTEIIQSGQISYNVSKAGLEMFLQSLAKEFTENVFFKPFVGALRPGLIDTGMYNPNLPNPFERLLKPQEVVDFFFTKLEEGRTGEVWVI